MTISYATESAYIPPPPPWWMTILRAVSPVVIAVAVASVLFAAILPKVNGYKQDVIADCGITVILAVSLTVVNGFTGQFSIGHSGFMALGGYAAASLMYYCTFHYFNDVSFHGGLLSFVGSHAHFSGHLFGKGDLLLAAALLLGGLVAAAVGWVVGLPSLRLRGDYLAIVTLGFCEVVRILLQQTAVQLDASDLDPTNTDPAPGSLPSQMTHLGGALGMVQVPEYGSVFWITAVAVFTVVLTIRLKYSAYGRALISIREDEVASAAVGVNVTKLKVRAFVLSAFFAGVAGGLYALHAGTIDAGGLGFQKSFDLIIVVVLGGMGSISGATIAAILLTILPEWLRDPPSLWPWGWAMAVVVAVVVVARKQKPVKPLVILLALCVGWEALVRFFPWYNLHREPATSAQYLSDYRLVLYALMLILMMIVRPQGLFGIHEIWDYLPARWRGQHVVGAGSPRPSQNREIPTPTETDTR